MRTMRLGCKDIGIRKSEFGAKTQFLSKDLLLSKVFVYVTCVNIDFMS